MEDLPPHWYLNEAEQANGDHEVHRDGCHCLPIIENRTALGRHAHCEDAVLEALARHPRRRINGCYFCAEDCHTT